MTADHISPIGSVVKLPAGLGAQPRSEVTELVYFG